MTIPSFKNFLVQTRTDVWNLTDIQGDESNFEVYSTRGFIYGMIEEVVREFAQIYSFTVIPDTLLWSFELVDTKDTMFSLLFAAENEVDPKLLTVTVLYY